MAALIRRFREAVQSGKNQVTCWGTGSPKREFLHVDDLADAAVFCLENWKYDPQKNDSSFLNVGTGTDISIKDLAELIANLTGYQGKISWDTSKPDGTPRKQLDVSLLSDLGWKAKIKLKEGIQKVISELAETDYTSKNE